MEDQLPTSPAPQLEYATPASDARVLYTREGDRATVVIHRPERRAKAAFEVTAQFFGEGLILLIMAGMAVASWWSAWVLVPCVPAFFLGFYGLAWLCSFRLSRPIIVELQAAELTALNLDTKPHDRHLDLKGVYQIKYVEHSKNIVIKRRGQEILELFVTPNANDASRIAEFLREAAGLENAPTKSH